MSDEHYAAVGNVVWKQRPDGTETFFSEHPSAEAARNEANALNEANDPGNYASAVEARFHGARFHGARVTGKRRRGVPFTL